jgi:hypothetical protein
MSQLLYATTDPLEQRHRKFMNNATTKIIVLKLPHPVSSYPAFTEKLRTFPHRAFAGNAFVLRTRLSVQELGVELQLVFGDQGVSFFVSEIGPPCTCHGADEATHAARELVERPEE